MSITCHDVCVCLNNSNIVCVCVCVCCVCVCVCVCVMQELSGIFGGVLLQQTSALFWVKAAFACTEVSSVC